jgi:hypothetical protein
MTQGLWASTGIAPPVIPVLDTVEFEAGVVLTGPLNLGVSQLIERSLAVDTAVEANLAIDRIYETSSAIEMLWEVEAELVDEFEASQEVYSFSGVIALVMERESSIEQDRDEQQDSGITQDVERDAGVARVVEFTAAITKDKDDEVEG